MANKPTYEELEQRVKRLEKETLERERVEEELQKRMNELETFYRATLGREERVVELKQEVNELLEQLGKNKKYRDYSK
jgi:predicted RNase H-like nuclease (RuvC/YqgF family)